METKILDEESIELIKQLMSMVRLDLSSENSEEDARKYFKLKRQLKEYVGG